jgi:hypothetical protein
LHSFGVGKAQILWKKVEVFQKNPRWRLQLIFVIPAAGFFEKFEKQK